jgi:glycosyltransferase involved in cell wall biosynthesis
VPARNEEACLGGCLYSLVGQEAVNFEVLLVDDGSTDRTREIASAFPDVTVLVADPLPTGWCGKPNACSTGARHARGEWLLFTDADTVHLTGSLARSLREAREHRVALLSYSPSQELHGLLQRAVMPVIFAELATTYKPTEINDPLSRTAAANGQYLLVSREAYDAVGGHAAVATSLLEDVALAQAVKRSGRKIRFRFGGDAVRTRMYRSFTQMREGWTKNLALLFASPERLAALRLLEFMLIVSGLGLAAAGAARGRPLAALMAGLASALTYVGFVIRARKAHSGKLATLLAVFGLPFFSYLLLRSRLYYKWHKPITWKGRQYSTEPAPPPTSSPAAQPAATGARWSI